MVDREALIKEFEGYSEEELEQKLEELREYKKSDQIKKDGLAAMTKTNQRIHTVKMLLGTLRRGNLKKELASMLKEYGEDDPEEVIQK